MRAFRKKKKQIQEEKAIEITRIVKESFAKLSAEEYKKQITIPVPQRFYCMEYKIYETPQEYNEEMNRRMQASDFRNNVAYKKGKEETAREIFIELYTEALRNTNEVVELTAFEIKQLAKEKGIEVGEII